MLRGYGARAVPNAILSISAARWMAWFAAAITAPISRKPWTIPVKHS